MTILNGVKDVLKLKQNTVTLVSEMFGTAVDLGSEECVEYLKDNPSCNTCFSYEGCCLVLTILNWVVKDYPDGCQRERLLNYVQGLYDGYAFGVSGLPRVMNDSKE